MLGRTYNQEVRFSLTQTVDYRIVEGIELSRRIGPHDLCLVNNLTKFTKGALKLEEHCSLEVPKIISHTDVVLRYEKTSLKKKSELYKSSKWDNSV